MSLDFLNNIDDHVEKIMKDWNVPGVALGIVKDGEIVLKKGYGYRNVKEGKEVTADTLFAIGSVTKSFTSLAIGLLVDEGKLDWDTPIKQYVPDFAMNDPVATERITIRDILSHRTGLPRHDLMWYNSSASREELVNRVKYLELNKDIRTTFQYNNLMYTVTGYIIEAITGQTWEEFVQKRIFDILGMEKSLFSVNDSQKTDDYALPYDLTEEGIQEIDFRNLDSIAPAGSINSNINDMLKYLLLQLGKGRFNGKELISESNLKQMHMPHISAPLPFNYEELKFTSYGMGWLVDSYRGNILVHHNGGIDGFLAYLTLLPEENFGSVILCNMNQSYSTTALAYSILDQYLGVDGKDWSKCVKEEIDNMIKQMQEININMVPERVQNTVPSHKLEDYIGKYESKGYGVVEIKKSAEDQLTLTLNSFEMSLSHHHYDIFSFFHSIFGGTYLVTFKTSSSGKVDSLSIPLEIDPTVKEIVFTRI